MRFPLPRTRRGWILGGVVVAVVALAAGGAIWFDRHYPWKHFRTVVLGGVYRAGQPTAENVDLAVDRYGIKTLVNLRKERGPWLEEERRAAEQAGIRFVDLPIEEGKPPSPEQVATLLALYDDPARRPLLYHCQYGSIRSAAVEALFRMEVLGESNAEALDRSRTFGTDLTKKYPAIAEFIRTYVPRRAGAESAFDPLGTWEMDGRESKMIGPKGEEPWLEAYGGSRIEFRSDGTVEHTWPPSLKDAMEPDVEMQRRLLSAFPDARLEPPKKSTWRKTADGVEVLHPGGQVTCYTAPDPAHLEQRSTMAGYSFLNRYRKVR